MTTLRPAFSRYLVRHGVQANHADFVARRPEHPWWFIRCGNGQILACAEKISVSAYRNYATRSLGGVVDIFRLHWKVDPEQAVTQ